MATKSDCTCQQVKNYEDYGPAYLLEYDPRCPFHKGPDEGYGYDQWGQPNTKASIAVGNIGAAIIVIAVLVVVGFGVAALLGAFG